MCARRESQTINENSKSADKTKSDQIILQRSTFRLCALPSTCIDLALASKPRDSRRSLSISHRSCLARHGLY
ncbi:uncharacterized protein MYCFIDRAFT_205786 [Pseudocercospora fijiensis CIRAD86]|uniref:Uncharacterized protein n=1 Tax=Pseudocercospora fijiensis (strain CIRAD86) TaxID=383855 RepID=N1QA26_PSEFD|nr:uncharacterized protein MYCFIDRAFT_205786 [Pseudocercospora fijiensis CIRAD86]EME87748.1 hypothetical protein MYCFIDRAFT_205786 [Pseudocercospora fijiensis CIRAD86]